MLLLCSHCPIALLMASLCKNILLVIHFVCRMILWVLKGGVLPPLPYLSFTLCSCLFRRGILTCHPLLSALIEHCIANAKFIFFFDSCTPQQSPLLNSFSYIAFLQTAASLLPVRLLQITCAAALARYFSLHQALYWQTHLFHTWWGCCFIWKASCNSLCAVMLSETYAS